MGHFFGWLLPLTSLLLFISGCNDARRSSLNSDTNPFTNDFKADAGGQFGSGSAFDTGIRNAIENQDLTNAQFETNLPQNLLDAIGDNLGDMSPEALAENGMLLEHLMQYCQAAASNLAPLPGEPMLGEWSGQCETKNEVDNSKFGQILNTLQGAITSIPGVDKATPYVNAGFAAAKSLLGLFAGLRSGSTAKATQFTVTGEYERTLKAHSAPTVKATQNNGFSVGLPYGNGVLTANGSDFNVRLVAEGTGKATVVSGSGPGGKPVISIGAFVDYPTAANGNIIQTEHKKRLLSDQKKTKSCNVRLTNSHNPIPRKVTEAYKQLGNCLLPAAMLFSPSINQLFEDLNPIQARLLKQMMLGIR